MLDRIFAVVSMLAVIAFMGVVTVFVMEPDLWIVTILVLSIAIAYFVRELKAGDGHFEGNDDTNKSGV